MSDDLFASLYLDECLPPFLVTMLQREGWRVTSALTEGQSGKSDPEQLVEATKRKSILVTCDKKTLLKEVGEVEHCGIIVVSRFVHLNTVPKIAKKISDFLNQYTADEFHNLVLVVTP